MGVKERIFEFIKYSKISIKQFEERCSLSNGYISSMRKGFGTEKLDNVLREFPELNREWLLYGEGDMLNNNISNSGDTISNKGNISHVVGNGNNVKTGDKIIDDKDISRLLDIIETQGSQFNERLIASQSHIDKLIDLLTKKERNG